MWVTEFYETEKGTVPVQNFLNSLDKKMRAKVMRQLLILSELGTDIREPYSKP